MRVLLLLAVVLAAGCSAPEGQQRGSDGAPEDLALAGAAEPPAFELYTPDALAALDVAVSVEPRWVRPEEIIGASVPPIPGATVDWSLASRNPIRTDLPAPLSARAQPEGASAFALREPGRHVFDVGGARLVVAIAPDAPPAGLLVVATQDEGAWSVVPHLLRGGPGTTLRIEDRGAADLLVRRTDVETYVASGPNATFTIPPGLEMGDYDVVAHVVGPDAAAEPAVRLIYDRRKPDEAWSVGPYTGGFDLAATAQPARHEMRLLLDSVDIRVDLATSSGAPLPFRVTARLLDGGGNEIASGEAPGFDVPRAPKGDASLVLTAEEGALLDYAASVSGRYLMEPPASFFNR